MQINLILLQIWLRENVQITPCLTKMSSIEESTSAAVTSITEAVNEVEISATANETKATATSSPFAGLTAAAVSSAKEETEAAEGDDNEVFK